MRFSHLFKERLRDRAITFRASELQIFRLEKWVVYFRRNYGLKIYSNLLLFKNVILLDTILRSYAWIKPMLPQFILTYLYKEYI